ncbi:MAG TPA: hypothetical protein G4N95_06590 [Anaerolineae bacterium]|nr:hypothetical protein [Anaerolineae bacterium]
MVRIIHTNKVGTERKRAMRGILIAIRGLAKKQVIDSDGLDMLAFILLSLEFIDETVERSASAWEKREYWIKADRFRREWAWVIKEKALIREAIVKKDWDTITRCLAEISSKLSTMKVSENHRMGKPWVGSYKAFRKKYVE